MKSEPDTRDAEKTRLLLLQFSFFDDPLRQDRTEFYPFYLGQARALGLTAQWLHCGVYSYETSHQNAHLVHVDDEEIRCLLDGIAPFGPTHLLVPDLLDAPVERAIRDAFPGVAIIGVHDQPVEVQKTPNADWLPGMLGLPTEPWTGRYVVDAVDPHYDCRLIDAPARYEPPPPNLLPVVCGPSCLYARPVTKNPYFAGVEFSERVMDLHACSFCCRAGGRRYVFATRPLALALKQCVAAASTRDKYFADVYRIRGAAVAARIGEFLAEIVKHDLPPCQFCFEFRVDELLHVADAIEAGLPALVAAGHSLYIYNTGLENFSTVEQERFNKGVTVEQVFESVDRVNRWRREFAGSFEFGNYGMVVFTPWTRLDDVQANFDGMQRLREHGISTGERHIGSKLQMFREIALYELALRDGVEFLDVEWVEGTVVDPETGFYWFDGHAKGSANAVELPWRFLHEETATFYEVVWRACMAREVDERAKQDPLLIEIQALIAARQDLWEDSLSFLRDALAVARSEPPPTTPAEIVDRLAASLPPPPPDPKAADGGHPAPNTAMERLLVDREARIHFALSNLATAPKSPLPGWLLVDFRADYSQGARGYAVELEKDGERLNLRLRPGDLAEEAFAVSESLKIAHAPSTPPRTPEQARAVRRLCSVLDYYLRHD